MSSPRTDGPPVTSTPPPIEWRYDAYSVGWLRALWYVAMGLLTGVFLLVWVVVLVGIVAILLTADPALRVLFGVLLLVGGPGSLLYLWPMLRDPDQRSPFVPLTDRTGPVPGWKTRLGHAVVGAVVVVAIGVVAPQLVLGVPVLGVLALLAVGFVSTRGTLDPEAATVSNAGVEHDIDTLEHVATYRVGTLVAFRLSYPRAPGHLSRPRTLFAPAASADAVERGLAHIAATTPDDASSRRRSNPQVRLVAGVLGVATLAGCVLALVVVDGGLGWYLAVLFGLFGLLMLYVGVVEG